MRVGFACAYLDDARENSPDSIDKFVEGIGSVVLSDYYVVAASGDDEQALKSFGEAIIESTANNEDILRERDNLMRRVVSQEVEGFAKAIEKGALQCEVDNSIRDQIYSGFRFEFKIERVKDASKHAYQLILGSRINADQAKLVSDYLNGNLFNLPQLQKLQQQLGTEKAYVARMEMDQ